MYLRPLDPSSSIPTSSSPKPNARKMMMMQQRCESGFKLRKLNDDVVEEEDDNSNKSLVSEQGVMVPHNTEPTTKEESQRVSAKSQLNILCMGKHWKPPVYESCDVEGPCHTRLFTVKATIEIKEEDSRITVVECYGDPQSKKKVAAEQAAEAALWYLKNVGHTLQTKKASRSS